MLCLRQRYCECESLRSSLREKRIAGVKRAVTHHSCSIHSIPTEGPVSGKFTERAQAFRYRGNVGAIAGLSRHRTRNNDFLGLLTQQVSSNIVDVQRGAGETGSASSQVLSAAQSLSSDSNRLKLEVGKFLSTVRAA